MGVHSSPQYTCKTSPTSYYYTPIFHTFPDYGQAYGHLSWQLVNTACCIHVHVLTCMYHMPTHTLVYIQDLHGHSR